MSIIDTKATCKLSNGTEIPYIGLGVFQLNDGIEVNNAVTYAVEAGYRHIDTAAMYGNERGVGEAIRRSGINRSEIFVTSKVWNSDQGYQSAIKAFNKSLEKLGFDYLDLYLIHWPVKGKYKETWKALEYIYKQGLVRAIGVSNFLQHHLEDLLQTAENTPMINQMEFHPYLVQQNLIDYCNSKKIVYEAWSPLMQGKILTDNLINKLAVKYGKTNAQIVLRWDIQKGVVTIPKSAHRERIISNADIFDFELSAEDVAKIDGLDRHQRIGADPDKFNF